MMLHGSCAALLLKDTVDRGADPGDNGVMTNTGAIMSEFERNCYGMTEVAIREQYMNSITARSCGLEMVVMGILSDVQELPAAQYSDTIRKQMNVAKFILSEMMDAKRAGAI
jgi:hypothetical protein